jgi:hypothetical protein
VLFAILRRDEEVEVKCRFRGKAVGVQGVPRGVSEILP